MTFKQKIKPWIGTFRLWLLAQNFYLVHFFYRRFWKPKPGTLSEILDRFSQDNSNIFFIQVGSNDGFQNDPLYKFVKRDAWKGIVLEPQKQAFKNLSFLYKKDAVIPINKALSSDNENKKLYKVAFCEDRWATGLSSFIKSHLEARIDDGYIDQKCEEYGITPPELRKDYIKAIDVPCTSFENLFETHPISKVDLLHIDTEGFDYEVIKMFDFEQFSPKLVVFEHIHLSEQNKNEAQNYLQSLGYRLTVDSMDIIAEKSN